MSESEIANKLENSMIVDWFLVYQTLRLFVNETLTAYSVFFC